jgi:hypothetical protein
MSKPIVLTLDEWRAIRSKLHKKYPPSYFIREKMKDKLGFTVREHNRWHPNLKYESDMVKYTELQNSYDELDRLISLPPERGSYSREIHLDFYDEKKRTMFILTYIGS